METFKKWFLFLMIAAMAPTVFISCSDDDDDGGSSPSSFVGEWTDGYDYISFYSDGTGEFYGGSYLEDIEWRVVGDRLDIEYDDYDEIEHYKYRFSNNGKTLKLLYYASTYYGEYEEADDEDWVTYYKVED